MNPTIPYICQHCKEPYRGYCDCQLNFICKKCDKPIYNGKCECSQEIKLLPCPFCGSININYDNIYDRTHEDVYYYCESCEGYGPTARGMDKAIEAWNTRKSPQDCSESDKGVK